GQRLGRLDPDPQAGEQTWPPADGDAADPAEVDPGPGEQLVQGGSHALLPRRTGQRDLTDELSGGADRHRRSRRGGVDADDDHRITLPATTESGPSRARPTDRPTTTPSR